jgi:folylpolyglutamate synthase/dihydropteroate synthase
MARETRIHSEDPPVLVDGALTPPLAEALSHALKNSSSKNTEGSYSILGIMDDKDISGNAAAAALASEIILTSQLLTPGQPLLKNLQALQQL